MSASAANPASAASTTPSERSKPVLCLADIDPRALAVLLERYGVALVRVRDGQAVRGSYWGAPEAGIVGSTLYARADTPVHSLLHELCHIVCTTEERRAGLHRDAGGDDDEECAVCYLQLILADCLPDVGRGRLMRDMDAWGYSFRLGSTARWFAEDADDARRWLVENALIARDGRSCWRLRQS